MSQHNFMEHKFHQDGEINGFKTCVQDFICRNCGLIIELPMGANHGDYTYEVCNAKDRPPPTNRFNVCGGRVQQSDGLHNSAPVSGNRHEVRGMRAKTAMRSAEKS